MITTDIKNCMLLSPTKLKNWGALTLNVSDLEIGSAIRVAQNIYLKEEIGKDLVERLQELCYGKISGSGASIDDSAYTQYAVLLNEYVTPILVYRTCMELTTTLSLKLRNMGVVRNSDSNVSEPDPEGMKELWEYYGNLHAAADNACWDFLCDNKPAFPELPDGVCSCTRKPRYGRTNLWLG